MWFTSRFLPRDSNRVFPLSRNLSPRNRFQRSNRKSAETKSAILVFNSPTRRGAMTPDERERMAALCERIAKEQDLARFERFVKELNELLKLKEQRLIRSKS